MTTPVITLSTPDDIVASVPHLLGFTPEDSVVVVALDGRRVIVTFRVDCTDSASIAALVGKLATKHSITSTLVVIYAETAGRPYVDLLPALRKVVPVHEMLLVRAGRWYSYTCPSPDCCPSTGTPVSFTPAADKVAGEVMSRTGRSTLATRAALAASIDTTGQAATVAELLLNENVSGVDADLLAQTVLDRYSFDPRYPVTVQEAAALLVAFDSCFSVRDRVLAKVGDEELHGPLLRMLTDLARMATGRLAPNAYAMLGAVAYSTGEGALANLALERAEGSSLGGLVGQAISASIPANEVRGAFAASA